MDIIKMQPACFTVEGGRRKGGLAGRAHRMHLGTFKYNEQLFLSIIY